MASSGSLVRVLALFVLSTAVIAAHATRLDSISPEGEIPNTRQIVLRFSGPIVALGDLRAAAPSTLVCNHDFAKNAVGRWSDDRTYQYDFERPLPAGVRCTVALLPTLKDQSGKALEGRRDAAFTTGGPLAQNIVPYPGGQIEEDQHFQLRLNGAVDFDTIERSAYCLVKGIGERIPLKIVQRDSLAAGSAALAKGQTPAPTGYSVTVRCQRPLPADTAVSIVWAKGIATTTLGGVAVTLSTDQVLNYTTRKPFTVSFSCERPQPNEPCIALAPMRVVFSELIARELADQIVMRGPSAAIKPRWSKDSPTDAVDTVEFAPPHPPNSEFVIELPASIRDDSGRALSNPNLFPLKVRTGELPPLVKFPAAPFGIIEWTDETALPMTVRNVEADLNIKTLSPSQSATASSVRVTDEVSVIEWLRRLNQLHEREITIPDKTDASKSVPNRTVPGKTDGNGTVVETRTLSLFRWMQQGQGPDAATDRQLLAASPIKQVALPKAESAKRPFEVIGLPITQPGLHIVEVESLLLGQGLLANNAPMYVRTGALVTNLAVHIKIGRENSLVWVTSLDRGQVVADAQVGVFSCDGKKVWEGRSDRNGIARIDVALPPAPDCADWSGGWLVSARKLDSRKREDFSFALSSWNKGIESWRFELPFSNERDATVRAHTVFDRVLLRAGETVSMKHYMRAESLTGLATLPADRLASQLRIVHAGSEQEFIVPLQWQAGRYAASSFAIPKDAKLGIYRVELVAHQEKSGQASFETGQFRVVEFRLPVLEGSISGPMDAVIAATSVPVDVQLKYLSGGPASNLPVQVSALQRAKSLAFADYEGYNFNLNFNRDQAGRDREARDSRDAGESPDQGDSGGQGKIVADKLAVTLNAQGQGKAVIADLKPQAQAVELLLEARFNDPNGETQTIAQTVPIYPSQVLVGIKTERWVSISDKLSIRTVTLSPSGKPQASIAVEVRAVRLKVISTRKRMTGGLYSYDSRTEEQDLGVVCAGRSNTRGEYECQTSFKGADEVTLIARAKDGNDRIAQADASIWVTEEGESWFNADNNDRIDLLPEKKRYEPDDTARLQVRMPFRYATALVAIEREGIIETKVVQLTGKLPSIDVAIKDSYGPNVFVSVLALRGRLREVPWYSMFTWGWREPTQWWRDRQAGRDFSAPTAVIDLAKPAYKLGIAQLNVGLAAHELKVTVTTDKARYQIREKAQATIKVTGYDGKPVAAGTQIALAAVDQALLELQANSSWNLLGAMMAQRSYGIENATAQMQVVGKRHYGRKAVAPGGGGGRAPTRELFDTLLLWQAQVALDEQGQARVEIPINDSLTTFKVVALADSPDQRFGSGSASFRVSQELQIASGLPPLVREGDQYTAMLTVRNSTDAAMSLQLTAKANVAQLASHSTTVELAANEAKEVSWPVQMPAVLVDNDKPFAAITWELSAKDTRSKAQDRVVVPQRVTPAVAASVLQATMTQITPIDATLVASAGTTGVSTPVVYTVATKQPTDAIATRGGVRVVMQSRLAEGLPGVRRYFEHYPFVCLEQKTSKSIGLRDAALWQTVVEQLPTYLDSDGLADYYPPGQSARASGSDVLTAYLLSVTDDAARLNPAFAIPQSVRETMERGLIAFVEGRIRREQWSPVKDLTVRRLAALEALSRHGKVTPSMLEPLAIDGNQLPTHALLDWYAVLLRTANLPQRDSKLLAVEQIIRSRLNYQGTRLSWTNERDDYWWWLMANSDGNSAKLLALAVDHDAWRDDVPKLAIGLLARFKQGHWMTTNANLLGSLAIDRFSQKFESVAVSGQSSVVLRERGGREQVRTQQWPGVDQTAGTNQLIASNAASPALQLDWPADRANAMLAISHDGSGKPWATIQTLAAIELKQPLNAGFRIERSVVPVTTRTAGQYSRGDVVRVKLRVIPNGAANWVVVNDPIPAGATILGSGLGRDSVIDVSRPDAPPPNATQPGAGAGQAEVADTVPSDGWNSYQGAWPAYEERAFDGFRSYYRFVSKHPFDLQYTLRLNNPGQFKLPPSRVEAMYNPEMFGMVPVVSITVLP